MNNEQPEELLELARRIASYCNVGTRERANVYLASILVLQELNEKIAKWLNEETSDSDFADSIRDQLARAIRNYEYL